MVYCTRSETQANSDATINSTKTTISRTDKDTTCRHTTNMKSVFTGPLSASQLLPLTNSLRRSKSGEVLPQFYSLRNFHQNIRCMMEMWGTLHGRRRGSRRSTQFREEDSARFHDFGQSWRRSKG